MITNVTNVFTFSQVTTTNVSTNTPPTHTTNVFPPSYRGETLVWEHMFDKKEHRRPALWGAPMGAVAGGLEHPPGKPLGVVHLSEAPSV